MALNIEFFKEHPYETGAVVIVGAIVVFYLLSSGGSSSTGSSSGSTDYQAALQADEQMSQISAAADVSNRQTQAQLQQTQIAAQVSDNQTAAQLATALATITASVHGKDSDNFAAVTIAANQLQSQENVYGMQEQVLRDQINAGVLTNANNNATALAATEFTVGAQRDVALTTLSDATILAQGQQASYNSVLPYILQHAGDQKNSALDAADQTALFQTILSGGNPGVAVSGNTTTSGVVSSGNATKASITNSLVGGIASIAKGLLGG